MKYRTNNKLTVWQELLDQLPWTPKQAPRSAAIALSKALWLGIEKAVAIQKILQMSVATFFRENPHLLFQTWEEVGEQMSDPSNPSLGMGEVVAASN